MDEKLGTAKEGRSLYDGIGIETLNVYNCIM